MVEGSPHPADPSGDRSLSSNLTTAKTRLINRVFDLLCVLNISSVLNLRQHIARVLCPLWSNQTFEQIEKWPILRVTLLWAVFLSVLALGFYITR